MPERPLPVGNGFIFATREDFLNGYQAGHLTYMAARTKHPQLYTDVEITELFLEKLEDMKLTTMYGIGFVVGWLHTVASNGTTRHAPSVATPAPVHSIKEEGK